MNHNVTEQSVPYCHSRTQRSAPVGNKVVGKSSYFTGVTILTAAIHNFQTFRSGKQA
ncbi:hypothetical protein B7P43_G13964 [Cryptotermes secundus]|uniref:Uncharacterized protein n=1 Tax=Cryptotermes secundus TaxID=105785 RepID=A0A2J7QD58_9NEOP|nr:hypothetical protein B7P43_G13964 [Cryptotermes secundus]